MRLHATRGSRGGDHSPTFSALNPPTSPVRMRARFARRKRGPYYRGSSVPRRLVSRRGSSPQNSLTLLRSPQCSRSALTGSGITELRNALPINSRDLERFAAPASLAHAQPHTPPFLMLPVDSSDRGPAGHRPVAVLDVLPGTADAGDGPASGQASTSSTASRTVSTPRVLPDVGPRIQ